MLTAQTMRRLELWSNLVSAGGTRLGFLANVLSCVATCKVDGDERLQVTLRIGATRFGGDAESSIVEWTVLRVSQDDTVFDEWVVTAVTRDTVTGITTIDAEPPTVLLARRGGVVGQQTGNDIRFDVEVVGLTPTQVFDTFVGPTLTAAGQSWVTRGLIDNNAPIDLTLEWATPLEVLRAIGEKNALELQFRRTGTSSYAIDLLTKTGGTTTAVMPLVVTESGVTSGGIGHVTDGDIAAPAWHTDTSVPGAYVQFDYGVATAIAAVRYFTQAGSGGPSIWKARSSDDGVNFTDRATGITTRAGGWNGASFPAVEARYWRLELTNTPGTAPWNTELEFVSAASTGDLRIRKNLLGVKQRRDGGPQSTRVYPRGATLDGYHATMARAVWQVVSIAGGVVGLADPIGGAGPILFDGQLVAICIRKKDGSLTGAITASSANAQTVTVPSAAGIALGDLIQFRHADSSDVTYVQTADGFKAVNVLDVPDVPSTNNVVPNPAARQYSNPAISPDGWGAISGATISKNTTAPFFKSAGQSVHVVTTVAGQGIQSPSGYVFNTFADQQAYGSGFATIWVVSGQVKVELVLVKADTTQVIRPIAPNVASSTTLGQWEDLGVAGEDFKAAGAVQAAVRITALGAAEFYVDAVQITESPSQQPYVEGSGGTRLWQAANEQLRTAGGPGITYDVPFVDLARLNAADYNAEAIVLGANVRVTDDVIPVSITTRITSVERDYITPGLSKVILSTLADDLTGTLARPPRPPRRDPVATGVGSTDTMTPIAAPAITLVYEVEDLNGIRSPVLLVAFTPPAVTGFAGLMISVRGFFSNSYATQAPVPLSPIRVPAQWGSTYAVQAWAVNKAGVRSDTPSTNSITIPQDNRIAREIPFLDPVTHTDDGYALHSSANDGRTAGATVNESGGRRINRLFAKPLAADPDTADPILSGTIRRIPLVGATDSTGNVDFSGSAFANKDIDHVADGLMARRTIQQSGGDNLAENPNFEATPIGPGVIVPGYVGASATISLDPVTPWSGTNSLKVVASAQFGSALSVARWKCTPGEVFNVSGMVRCSGAGDQADIQLQFLDASGGYLSGVQAASGIGATSWGFASARGTAPANTVMCQLTLQSNKVGGGTVWFDDILVLRERQASEVNRGGGNTTQMSTIVGNVTDGGHAGSGMQESGGKSINRLYAKPLSSDPDTADSVSNGSTKRVTTNNEATGGGRGFSAIDSGNVVVAAGVDFSRSYTGKHLGNMPDDAGSDRRAATANEKTGGSRGFNALDSNNRLNDQRNMQQVSCGGVSAVQTSHPLTGTGSGGGGAGSISIAAHTVRFGFGTVSYGSGLISVVPVGTYFVYADDPTFAGGAVTYIATTTPEDIVADSGRYFVGKVGVPPTATTLQQSAGGGGSQQLHP